ncbi:mannose-6-phosphate isomerase, class I [Devriesea agamarum]|uniref:mannose-6-phosphate isomerase, class I n=1 Tax=Devriesea agamarum TaxID=472569 RepID=UPI00071E152A|nr:mannose-6-phosphate isomerase, class I [Devriesea agamarum]
MWMLEGRRQSYAWGSVDALPRLLGVEPDQDPFAEIWFGAHPVAPALVQRDGGPITLDAFIQSQPRRVLGDASLRRFGPTLPYLLKMIAPAKPLSLQVHPSLNHARESYAAENAAGIALDDPARNYRDDNHKPEMIFALSRFEALCGFRTPRRAASILEGLGVDLTDRLHALLCSQPTATGMRAAFRALLSPHIEVTPTMIEQVVVACSHRLCEGTSPSPRIDAIVASLHEHHPGDPGVLTALLLNPVTLEAGEAMFVPAGAVHCYLSGLAVEIMAASDNVLRAGLTPKRVDADEMLRCVSCVAAPPMRVAAERAVGGTDVFYAPVDDFELSVTRLEGGRSFQPRTRIPGSGARILLAVEGEILVETGTGRMLVRAGEAVLVADEDGDVWAGGCGCVVQGAVP